MTKVLQGEQLLSALTSTALEMQRSRTIRDLVSAVGAGLEREGFEVGLLSVEAGEWSVRYRSTQDGIAALHQLFSGTGRHWPQLAVALAQETPALVKDLRGSLLESDAEVATVAPLLPTSAIAAPVYVRGARWGALLVARESLTEAELPVFRFFAQHLGGAIEVCDGFEHLQRRTAELELVHALAISGEKADFQELCHRALATLCRIAQTNAAVLHRREENDDFVLVGVYGAEGPIVEKYRRFRVPEEHLPVLEALAVPTRELPIDSDAVSNGGFAHIAVVPLTVEGRNVGMLTLTRSHDQPFLEADVRSAEILGVQMTTLLERARLYDESRRLYAELKDSYDQLGRAQQELIRHERLAAVGELAAVMAHEVRNPLGVIFNSLTTLKRIMRVEGDVEMLLNMVGEEADRLNRIVGDLLEFVRPWELEKKPTAVEPIIANAIDAAAQAALKASVRVVAEFPRELPPYAIDGPLLKQALANLIVNAAQAMPKGGTVLVHATTEAAPGGAHWLVVRVRDEGVGLSERASSKMFQPFFTTKATGTGLGLAVVKRVVDSHAGEVSARANEDGPGTTFTVKLPPASEREQLLTPQARAAPVS